MVASDAEDRHCDAPSRQDALAAVQRAIRACERCVVAGYLEEAHPVFRGDASQRLMIVGQAPGRLSHERDQPWTGPGGEILRGWLASAGFPPETFLDTWYLTSLTKCFPGSAAHGKGDRAPSSREIRLCGDHLTAEIALVQPALVVTLGRLAAVRLIPDIRKCALADFIGQSFSVDLGYGEIPIVPLPHPSGVSRWLNDPANRERTAQGLAHVAAHSAQRALMPRLS